MNILIEGGNLNDVKEGTRNIAIAHAKKLIKRGHNVTILTRQKNPFKKEKEKKVEFFEKLKFYRWANYFDLYFLYQTILKKEKIDVVHIFAKGLRPKRYIKFLKKYKTPLFISLLGMPLNNPKQKKKMKSLKYFDKIFVPSKTIKKFLKKQNIPNVKHLPYGIDTNFFKPEKNSKKTYKILCTRTPLISLMKSFLLFNQNQKKKYKIILNRKRIFSNELKNIVKENIKQIEFIGYIENIEKLYSKADLFIDLHNEKKFLGCASPPLAILEAMSCGKKILSTQIPEIEEIIKNGKNGFLVKENSLECIMPKIKKALNSKPKIKQNCRKTILNNFNLDDLIIKYEKIYWRYLK